VRRSGVCRLAAAHSCGHHPWREGGADKASAAMDLPAKIITLIYDIHVPTACFAANWRHIRGTVYFRRRFLSSFLSSECLAEGEGFEIPLPIENT
jgi:hypothetical protein